MSALMDKYDLLIAGGLAVIIIVLLFMARVSNLPKKNLAFIGAALAAILGISLWKKSRQDALRAHVKQQEAELKELEKKMAATRGQVNESYADLERMKGEYERSLDASKKQVLMIEHERDENLKRIEGLSGAELREEYKKKFGAID